MKDEISFDLYGTFCRICIDHGVHEFGRIDGYYATVNGSIFGLCNFHVHMFNGMHVQLNGPLTKEEILALNIVNL